MSLPAETKEWISAKYPEHLSTFEKLTEEAKKSPGSVEIDPVVVIGERPIGAPGPEVIDMYSNGAEIFVQWGGHHARGPCNQVGWGIFPAPPAPDHIVGQTLSFNISGRTMFGVIPRIIFITTGDQKNLDGSWRVQFYD